MLGLPYVRHAPEGGISIGEYGSVLQWLRRVEALPGFKPMPSLALPPAR
jgi:glutathione S-transferase